MKRVSEYLEYKISEESKEKKWNKIMRARIDWWEKEYNRINSVKSIPEKDKEIICKEISLLAALEAQGGKCPRCEREWEKVNFDNIFRSGEYYKPQCQCYFKCPVCKKHLYDSYVTTRLKMNKYRCHYCDWVLLFGNKKRHGAKYELWYDSQRIKPANLNLKAEQEKKEKEEKIKKGKEYRR